MKLPPWGVLSQEYQPIADLTAPIPDWRGDPKPYYDTFDAGGGDMASHIWPQYDTASMKWHGGAEAFADDMTKTELQIAIERFQKADVLSRVPDTPHYTGTNPKKD